MSEDVVSVSKAKDGPSHITNSEGGSAGQSKPWHINMDCLRSERLDQISYDIITDEVLKLTTEAYEAVFEHREEDKVVEKNKKDNIEKVDSKVKQVKPEVDIGTKEDNNRGDGRKKLQYKCRTRQRQRKGTHSGRLGWYSNTRFKIDTPLI